jgi:tripartite-type tricarboxylate transporter receptor subunit TctC
MTIATRRSLFGAGLALAAVPRIARAQDAWPNRPITMVIPWAAGGSTDVIGRVLAQTMAADLGQPIVIENRSGAAGTLGHAHVARARPDGYTILMATNSTYAMAPHMMRSLPYDNRGAFVGVSLVARSAQTLSVHPSVPVENVAQFVAYAKARPGALSFSSAGVGASSHLATELLMAKTGIQMVHVPYRGGGPAAQGLLAGEVQVCFIDLVTALPHRATRALKVLGVGTAERSQFAPDLPTLAEAGVPGFDSATDASLLVPAGTPAPIVTRLSASLLKALQEPETRRRILQMGVEPIGGSVADFDAYWTRESDKWGEIIRAQNIRSE